MDPHTSICLVLGVIARPRKIRESGIGNAADYKKQEIKREFHKQKVCISPSPLKKKKNKHRKSRSKQLLKRIRHHRDVEVLVLGSLKGPQVTKCAASLL